jgi:hypothetical protein
VFMDSQGLLFTSDWWLLETALSDDPAAFTRTCGDYVSASYRLDLRVFRFNQRFRDRRRTFIVE